MKTHVGVRQLRAGLARYVARARAGETIIVTVDGEPAARLAPLGGRELGPLDQLASSGRAQPPTNRGGSQTATSSLDGAAVERRNRVISPDIGRVMTRIRG